MHSPSVPPSLIQNAFLSVVCICFGLVSVHLEQPFNIQIFLSLNYNISASVLKILMIQMIILMFEKGI